MNTLPTPVAREPIHTRRVTTRGYLRADGLWDLDGELLDTKSYDAAPSASRQRKAGEPVHHMLVRLTIDDDLVVRDAVAAMPSTPFPECQPAAVPMTGLIGARIGPGWRRSIAAAMGGVEGCTHLRELLSAMATVGYQTVAPYLQRRRVEAGEPHYRGTEPAPHFGQCVGWDFNGAVIARVAPQFIGWVRPEKPQKPPSSDG